MIKFIYRKKIWSYSEIMTSPSKFGLFSIHGSHITSTALLGRASGSYFAPFLVKVGNIKKWPIIKSSLVFLLASFSRGIKNIADWMGSQVMLGVVGNSGMHIDL